jgi:hypothetical protein
VLGLARNRRLEAAIGRELQQARRTCRATDAPDRVFADLTYRTRRGWARARRVVAKAEVLPGLDGPKANPRFVVTSLAPDTLDAQPLYEQLYCARGDMENRIKEQQLMLFADRTSTATLRANHLRLTLSSVAYTLLAALRRLGLAGTALATAQCQTIQLTLLKIGARLRVTVRKVWVALASSYIRIKSCSRASTRTCSAVDAVRPRVLVRRHASGTRARPPPASLDQTPPAPRLTRLLRPDLAGIRAQPLTSFAGRPRHLLHTTCAGGHAAIVAPPVRNPG